MTNNPLDVVWILLCTVLVIMMQPGFVFFETGLTRTKNSISVAIKNLADFCIVGGIFGFLGYGLMFGDSIDGLIGSSQFLFEVGSNSFDQAYLLFQLSFCATSVTIISGAVAERIRFSGYLFTAFITSSIIYPIVGHWIWAGHDFSKSKGWLENIGFIDFAGATVVHAVGGSAALAAIMVIGARLGRFDDNQSYTFQGENLTYAAAGTFLLIMGWFGFNGGSLLATDDLLPLVFLNTMIAAVFGGAATTLLSWFREKQANIVHIMMGILAGLVAITGACNMVTPLNAAVIGVVAGGVSILGVDVLEKLKIDDAVGAVPVHLFPGIWGTLAVALFCHPDNFIQGYSRWEQFFVQSIGIISAVVYSFSITYIFLKLIDRFFSLRVSPDVERIGLNAGEHGATSEIYMLAEKMHDQSEENNFSTPVKINPHSDIGALQLEYNRVLDTVQSEIEKRKVIEDELRAHAKTDGLTQLANRQHFDEVLDIEWSRAKRDKKCLSVIFLDVDHFKKFNDCFGHQAGDVCLINISKVIASFAHRTSDLVARYGGEEFIFLLPDTNLKNATVVAEKVRSSIVALNIKQSPSDANLRVTISLGVASTYPHQGHSSHQLVERADKALYCAKESGRNSVKVSYA